MSSVEKVRVLPECEKKKRRIGIWRRGGSIYVNLAGEICRTKSASLRWAEQDKEFLNSIGGFDRLIREPWLITTSVPPRHKSLLLHGVPLSVGRALETIGGIKELYDWQVECLGNICRSSNVVSSFIYSAPTSGGKSIVADLITLRRLVFEGKRALIVCPFVSICKERASWLRQFFGQTAGIVIEEFHGPLGKPWHPGIDIAVCTVQKALGIVNKLCLDEEEPKKKFSDYISTIVVDEFHLVNEPGGSVMESLVTRIGMLPDRRNILLIGMSATIPQRSEKRIIEWLHSHGGNCEFFKCDFRPISLQLYTKRGLEIEPVDVSATNRRTIVPRFEQSIDTDNFASLVIESFDKNLSTIVFCATRLWCEKAAALLSRTMGGCSLQDPKRMEILEALKLLSPCGVHPVLEQSVKLGVAFHHAGMTTEERSIVELGFRNRTILVLCATSTLSAGVNLPAERVILRTLSAASGGVNPLSCPITQVSAKLKQMVGRAGRIGHSQFGEAIIFCSNQKEQVLVCNILRGNNSLDEDPSSSIRPIAIQNGATDSGEVSLIKSLAKELVEVIIFMKIQNIETLVQKFSCAKLYPDKLLITRAIDYLVSNRLVAIVRGLIVPTAIGDAVAHSAMPVDEAEQVYGELSQARAKLCLSGGDLHLLYLVTPPITITEKEFEEFIQRNEDMFLGRIPEIRSILGSCDTSNRRKRVILALILRDLVSTDSSIGSLASRYGVQSGTIQYLQSNAATYCAMVASFCDRLQWASLAAALNSIKPRLHFGVPESLISLMEVEGVSRSRARALAQGGFTTVDKIANADPVDLAIALTRDLTVEGTQMSTETGAHRILNVTCELIIENARIKLGLSPKRKSVVGVENLSSPSDLSSIELFSPVSAPELPDLIHQLIGTQSEEPLSDFAFIDDEMLLGAERTPIQQSPERPENLPIESPFGDDDQLLLEAFESIEARVSTVPPSSRRRRRRISEMTTIDVGPYKQQRRTFDDTASSSFIIPINETILSSSSFNSSSMIFRDKYR